MSENLNDLYFNAYSQRGEDGIIEEVCRRLGLDTGVCVEFGAGDGMSLSNTRNLINKGWTALMIESVPSLFNICKLRYRDNSKVTCLNVAVDRNQNKFENLFFNNYGPYIHPDIVSIDIDGMDFEIFKDIKKYRPKLYIVECNPYRYPLDTERHEPVSDLQQSLYVFNQEAEKMGYRAICYTQNIFFIDAAYIDLFDPPDLMTMFINGFVRSFHLETDPDEKNRIFKRIKEKFGLDNNWLKNIIEEHCGG